MLIDYEKTGVDDVVVIDFDGEIPDGNHDPSLEWQMNRAVYEARDDVEAIVHTPSEFATVLAALETDLPPFLEEITMATGGTVEVTNYAPSGSEALGEEAVAALGDKNAVLLSKHGVLCCARTSSRPWQPPVRSNGP